MAFFLFLLATLPHRGPHPKLVIGQGSGSLNPRTPSTAKITASGLSGQPARRARIQPLLPRGVASSPNYVPFWGSYYLKTLLLRVTLDHINNVANRLFTSLSVCVCVCSHRGIQGLGSTCVRLGTLSHDSWHHGHRMPPRSFFLNPEP